MKPGTEVRALAPQDLPVMRQVLALFGTVFNEPHTYAQAQPDDAYLAGLLGSDGFVTLAALEQGRVVGALAGYVLRKFEQRRSEFYLYDLAVASNRRRQGVATALIGALQAMATRRGWWVIFVQADPQDEPAVALYSKLGLREDVLHFDIAPR